jgi:hypothetical protein
MPTLREAIQAKIDGKSAEVQTLSSELTANGNDFGDWIDADPVDFAAKVAAFQAEVTKHIG